MNRIRWTAIFIRHASSRRADQSSSNPEASERFPQVDLSQHPFRTSALLGRELRDGNINVNCQPAGFSMTFTGMEVLNQDGSQFEGIGIQPDVPAGRTRQGIAKGIDEILSPGPSDRRDRHRRAAALRQGRGRAQPKVGSRPA